MGNKPRSKTRPKSRTQQRPRPKPAQQQQSRNWLRVLLIAGGAVVVIGLLVLAFGGLESSDVEPPEGVQTFSGLERVHTEDFVAYDPEPPVGGAHAPVWLNCGYYSQPVPNENAVHSLEHGAVWITYQPDLDEGSVDRLKDFAEEPKILVSPYPGLDTPVVASTWGNQIRLDSAEDPRLRQFVRALKDGPDTPEPGASCFGGIGNPE